MSLARELAEAKARVARVKFALDDVRSGRGGSFRSSGSWSDPNPLERTGATMKDLEAELVEAEADLTRVEVELVERARGTVQERDPEYAQRIGDARLLGDVERAALIGAADRLSEQA